MKTKTIKKEHGHITQCEICFEMERRGYRSERLYWDHFFKDKLKPIKYKIMYDGEELKEVEK